MAYPAPGDNIFSRFPGAEYLGVVVRYDGGTVTFRNTEGEIEDIAVGDVFAWKG